MRQKLSIATAFGSDFYFGLKGESYAVLEVSVPLFVTREPLFRVMSFELKRNINEKHAFNSVPYNS